MRGFLLLPVLLDWAAASVRNQCIVDAIIGSRKCGYLFNLSLYPVPFLEDCGGRSCLFPLEFCAENQNRRRRLRRFAQAGLNAASRRCFELSTSCADSATERLSAQPECGSLAVQPVVAGEDVSPSRALIQSILLASLPKLTDDIRLKLSNGLRPGILPSAPSSLPPAVPVPNQPSPQPPAIIPGSPPSPSSLGIRPQHSPSALPPSAPNVAQHTVPAIRPNENPQRAPSSRPRPPPPLPPPNPQLRRREPGFPSVGPRGLPSLNVDTEASYETAPLSAQARRDIRAPAPLPKWPSQPPLQKLNPPSTQTQPKDPLPAEGFGYWAGSYGPDFQPNLARHEEERRQPIAPEPRLQVVSSYVTPSGYGSNFVARAEPTPAPTPPPIVHTTTARPRSPPRTAPTTVGPIYVANPAPVVKERRAAINTPLTPPRSYPGRPMGLIPKPPAVQPSPAEVERSRGNESAYGGPWPALTLVRPQDVPDPLLEDAVLWETPYGAVAPTTAPPPAPAYADEPRPAARPPQPIQESIDPTWAAEEYAIAQLHRSSLKLSERQERKEEDLSEEVEDGNRIVRGHCIVDGIISNHQCAHMIFELGLFPLDSMGDCGGRRCRFPAQFCAESQNGNGCANMDAACSTALQKYLLRHSHCTRPLRRDPPRLSASRRSIIARPKDDCIIDAMLANRTCAAAVFKSGVFPIGKLDDCGGQRCAFPPHFCAESFSLHFAGQTCVPMDPICLAAVLDFAESRESCVEGEGGRVPSGPRESAFLPPVAPLAAFKTPAQSIRRAEPKPQSGGGASSPPVKPFISDSHESVEEPANGMPSFALKEAGESRCLDVASGRVDELCAGTCRPVKLSFLEHAQSLCFCPRFRRGPRCHTQAGWQPPFRAQTWSETAANSRLDGSHGPPSLKVQGVYLTLSLEDCKTLCQSFNQPGTGSVVCTSVVWHREAGLGICELLGAKPERGCGVWATPAPGFSSAHLTSIQGVRLFCQETVVHIQ